jgi:hypothetical protein
MKFLMPLAFSGSMLALNSCGVTDSLGAVRERLPGMPNMQKVAMPKFPEVKRGDIARFSWSDLLPSRLPIVEVREDDLEEMQLGRDKALAYQKQGAFFHSWYGGEVDFQEPELPSGALDNPEFGLLPPKSE